MICPRWLVQSSAAGVVGVALIAVPFWMDAAPDAGADEVRLQQTSLDQAPEVDSDAARIMDRAVESTEDAHRSAGQAVRNVRARQVRHHLVETYRGPTCPHVFEVPREVPPEADTGSEHPEQDREVEAINFDDALLR